MTEVVALRGVTKHFDAPRGGQPAVAAVADVDLTVADNEFVTVLGPSGCGKTTLLRLIAGLDHPSAGQVLVRGQEVTGPGADRVVVFQQPWLYPWLSVRDNVAFGLRLHARRPDLRRVDEILDVVGLSAFANSRTYHLSGGMQQRCALARALVMSPKVLLMDEPFGALDAQTRADMQEFLLQLWERVRATIVFITHDVEEAILLGDRLVVMTPRPGRIALDVPIALPRPRTEETALQPAFLDLRRQALACLRHQEPYEPAAGGARDAAPGRPR